MKLIVAIVRPEKLNDTLEQLFKADIRGLTISRVQGHGGETDTVQTYRGTTVKMELHEKVRLEIGVSDGFVYFWSQHCNYSKRLKVRIIKYLESQHGLLCNTGPWKELSKEDKSHVIKTLNGSWSKSTYATQSCWKSSL